MLTLSLLSRMDPCSQSLSSLESLLEALGSSVLSADSVPLVTSSQIKQPKQHWPQRQSLFEVEESPRISKRASEGREGCQESLSVLTQRLLFTDLLSEALCFLMGSKSTFKCDVQS